MPFRPGRWDMRVRDRLNALRRQAAGDENAVPEKAAAGLAERVDRLKAGRGKGIESSSRPADEVALAEALSARTEAPGVLLIERREPWENWRTNRFGKGLTRALWDLPEARDLDPAQLLFLDTETTGLAGGSGTHVFLLGLARIHRGALIVRQYLLTRFSGEAELLTLAGDWMAGVEAVASYNGKTFDLPLLSVRCRLAGVRDPFLEYPHIDLLHSVRRAFGSVWPDCRLSTAERRLLGFERQDDLPGAEAPQAWFDFMRRGDPRRLPGVCRHNRRDLVSLAALLPVLTAAYGHPGSAGADVLAVARAWLGRGDEPRALRLLSEHRQALNGAGLLELARLLRRGRRWEEAEAVWNRLAAAGNVAAREHLAKYHEHVSRDYSAAFSHASRLPPGPGKENRCRRLNRRLGKL